MASPGKLLSPIWSGLAKTIDKGLGVGQTPSDAPTINIPAPPPLAPEATTPTAKPAKKGQQQSFLSGVAASALGGQSGSSTGKSLLGS